MDSRQRAERLRQDQQDLAHLAEQSGILRVEPQGDPPDRYRLEFAGQGVGRVSSLKSEVQWIDVHRIELRLPFLYPSQPPDIHWETSLFHPNLSYSGFLNLDDVGLPWSENVGLDVVCERLWDVARLAYINLDRAVNPTARRWVEETDEIQFPVDPRPLRKIELPGARSNVVRYQRRGGATLLSGSAPEAPETEILFIDDSTLPGTTPPAAPQPAPQTRAHTQDDDVFYIGDD
ncbi:MAG: hypothetical protein KDB14_21850 [Planctomycetales bacterium]|nr:hypothetical protein [Planctomycetales bacterium]